LRASDDENGATPAGSSGPSCRSSAVQFNGCGVIVVNPFIRVDLRDYHIKLSSHNINNPQRVGFNAKERIHWLFYHFFYLVHRSIQHRTHST